MAKKILTALVLVVTAGAGSSWAANLTVNCGGGGEEAFASISAALAHLDPREPNTVTVYGSCRENLVIQSTDRLTLTAVNGASISDASGGTHEMIDIIDSRDVAINGFTINASATKGGLFCLDSSVCRLSGNLIRGAFGAVAVGPGSRTTLEGDTLETSASGLVIDGSVSAIGVTVQNNGEGVTLRSGAWLNFNNSVSKNNSGSGIFASGNSTLTCFGCSVTGNGADGVHLELSAFARLDGRATITGNGGAGVSLSTLSSAFFAANVTGNHGRFDVLCNFQYSATQGVVSGIGGGTTNCVEP